MSKVITASINMWHLLTHLIMQGQRYCMSEAILLLRQREMLNAIALFRLLVTGSQPSQLSQCQNVCILNRPNSLANDIDHLPPMSLAAFYLLSDSSFFMHQ